MPFVCFILKEKDMKFDNFFHTLFVVLLFLISKTIFAENSAITIKPFRACRANNDLVGLIACEDYNMLSIEQARKIAEANPLSFLHVARPEVDCEETTQPYDPQAGLRGYDNLQEFLQKNILLHDTKPALYLYGRLKNAKLQVGIVGLVHISAYQSGNIKRHENIIPSKEKKLRIYTSLQRAQVDPVLLLHEQNQELSSLVETVIHKTPHQAFLSNSQDQAVHLVWVVDDKKTIKKICSLFKKIKTLYIADGHHRTAVASEIQVENTQQKDGASEYCMAGIFPFDQVTISSFNRIFKDLNQHTAEEFLAELKQYFDIEEVSSAQEAVPQKPHSFGIYCKSSWYKISLKKGIVRSYTHEIAMLDIAILSNLILKPFLDIDIYKPDDRTEFIAGMWGLEALEDDCKKNNWPLAIAFFPVRTETFSMMVNEGKLMPPKTTCFEPKVRPGLFTYTFDCAEEKKENEEQVDAKHNA